MQKPVLHFETKFIFMQAQAVLSKMIFPALHLAKLNYEAHVTKFYKE